MHGGAARPGSHESIVAGDEPRRRQGRESRSSVRVSDGREVVAPQQVPENRWKR
jgi:hypothetical protein